MDCSSLNSTCTNGACVGGGGGSFYSTYGMQLLVQFIQMSIDQPIALKMWQHTKLHHHLENYKASP